MTTINLDLRLRRLEARHGQSAATQSVTLLFEPGLAPDEATAARYARIRAEAQANFDMIIVVVPLRPLVCVPKPQRRFVVVDDDFSPTREHAMRTPS